MSEIIDVFDANLNILGSMDKKDAHQAGMWHRTFHLWLISSLSGGKILYQLRSPQKEVFPNLLDVSAAGHLKSGEEPKDGRRELFEEFGMRISKDAMVDLGYRVEVSDHENGDKNREFQAVFMAQNNTPIDQISPSTQEVFGLVEFTVKDSIKLHSGEKKVIDGDALLYNNFSDTWERRKISVDERSFIPRVQKYYLTISIMAERFLEGHKYISVS